jgi:transposase
MKVLIGVDPHKASLAVAAVDEATDELLEHASFPQDRTGLRALERWSKRFPKRRWAMETARGLGPHLAVRLAGSGESVVDVPPKLSAKVRGLSTGNARKNDGLDALATALAASRNETLAAVDPEADSEVLRLLSERREDLVAERTRAPNRLHGFLRDLVPGGVAGKLSSDRAARILRGIRARGNASVRLRRRLASEILRDIRTLERKIADLKVRIEAEVEASGTTLTEIFGVGPILAATILGTVGDVTRFPTKAHFASYSGTAPVESSSGKVVRHRLSLGGNRHLNYALHMVATSQARSGAPGGTYYRKKIGEGKSSKEALSASSGASATPSTGASRRIRKRRRAAQLDKEEPRMPLPETVWKLGGERDGCLRSSLWRARDTPRICPMRNGVASALIFPNPPEKGAPGFTACGRSSTPSSTC